MIVLIWIGSCICRALAYNRKGTWVCTKNRLRSNAVGKLGVVLQRVHLEVIAPFRPRVSSPNVDYLTRCPVRYAREHHSAQVGEMPDEDLFLCTKSGIARARQNGFHDFESIAVFVGLMLDTAPNFDEHELIRRALTDPKLSGVARLDALLETTSDESWQEVIDRYDDQAWSFALSDENELAECQELNSKMYPPWQADGSSGLDHK